MPASKDAELLPITGTIQWETEKAWLFDSGNPTPVWLPKSLCTWDPDEKTMMVPDWLVERNNLI